jgi:glycyl-tRNA synthetase (class II)
MEETMETLTITELMKRTRNELCGLADRITIDLTKHAEGSSERTTALRNLRNIRRVIAWYDLPPE